MVAESTRSRFAMYGVVPSVIVHALVVAGLYFTPEHEPEEEPNCPTQEDVCRARCAMRPIAVPDACPEPKPCRCDLVPLELMEPEVLAEITLPPEPEQVEPPVPPPPPQAEPPDATALVVEKTARKSARRVARTKAVEAARSESIVRVLGTYGGGDTTVLDVLTEDTTHNDLDALFSEGLTTSKREDPSVAGAAAGGELHSLRSTLPGAVRRKVRGLQTCHTKSSIEAGVEGTIALEISVDDGKPTKVDVVEDTTGSMAVRDCVVDKVEAWRFSSETEGDASFRVVFRTVD